MTCIYWGGGMKMTSVSEQRKWEAAFRVLSEGKLRPHSAQPERKDHKEKHKKVNHSLLKVNHILTMRNTNTNTFLQTLVEE